MTNLSLRGVDDATLARIKASARRRKVSVNRLIVETLRQQFSLPAESFDDLDDLAGSWSQTQAAEFDAAVAPLGEVEPGLWVAEDRARYRVANGKANVGTRKASKVSRR